MSLLGEEGDLDPMSDRETERSMNRKAKRVVSRQGILVHAFLGLVFLAGCAEEHGDVHVPASQREISGDVVCSECSIRAQEVATLEGDRVAGEPRSIVRTSKGHYLVAFWPTGDEILEFDSSGRFLRVFAPTGQGPGEVTRVGHIEIIGSDTVRVYDLGRVQTFSRSGEFLRAERLPVSSVENAVSLNGDRVVLNAGTSTPDGEGAPLQLVQGNDAIRFFGVVDPTVGPDTPHLMLRSLTSDGVRRIWSAGLTKYEIREWNPDGESAGSWTREVPWFRPWNQLSSITAESPPDPRLVDIQWTAGDRLLVLLRIPSQDWREHLGPPQHRPGQEPMYPEAAWHRVFGTRFELVDLSEGRVILQADEPQSAVLFMGDGHIAGYSEDEMGEPAITIWEYSIDTAGVSGK